MEAILHHITYPNYTPAITRFGEAYVVQDFLHPPQVRVKYGGVRASGQELQG